MWFDSIRFAMNFEIVISFIFNYISVCKKSPSGKGALGSGGDELVSSSGAAPLAVKEVGVSRAG